MLRENRKCSVRIKVFFSRSAGFLFLYHLHGRDALDVHVHMLLLYAVFGGALVCLLEVFHRGNVLLELLRAALCLLQGSWFWQVSRNVHKNKTKQSHRLTFPHFFESRSCFYSNAAFTGSTHRQYIQGDVYLTVFMNSFIY